MVAADTASNEIEQNCLSGWFSKNEILRLNAFEAHTMSSSESDQLLEGLLQLSEKEWGHTRQQATHATNPLRSQFWYRKFMGLQDRFIEREQIQQVDRCSGSGSTYA